MKIQFFFLMGALMLSASMPVWADDATTVRKEIEAAHARQAEAMKAKDARGFLGTYAPDFEDGAGHHKTSEMEKQTREQLEANIIKRFRRTIDSVTVQGDTATVKETSDISLLFLDKKGVLGKKNRKRLIEQLSHDVETWIKTDTGWKLKKVQSTAVKATLDGKSTLAHSAAKPQRR